MTRASFLLPVLLLVQLQAAAPPAIPEQGVAALSRFLGAAVAQGDVPGIVAMVVNRDEVLYHEAFGRQNVAKDVPMAKDAIFRIASMTKPMTSVAVMMLVEEGKLALDDQASTYVPAFRSPKVLAGVDQRTATFATRPATRPITIRHLLTHTSGIGYTWSDPSLALVQKQTGQGSETDLPLLHDPGVRWTYGAGTKVLGDIVETITGRRIDAFIDARISRPLGMQDTAFVVPPDKHARVVTTLQKANGAFSETQNPPAISSPVRGDGGLHATAADYGRFLQMLLNRGQRDGVRLLSERTVRDMTRNQIGRVVVQEQPSANPALSKPYPLGAGEDTWGLGFQVAAPRSPKPNMRRPGSYTWAGIFNTHFWVDPREEIGVILLMQVLPFYDEGAIRVLTGFEELVYTHLRS
jgi:CubicO group peptidase (beta-lactamase class C family)